MTNYENSTPVTGRATMTRRAALLGLASVPVAGAAGAAIAAVPADILGDLIARYDAADMRLGEVRAGVADLEARHSDLVKNWPEVELNATRFQSVHSLLYFTKRWLKSIEAHPRSPKFIASFRREAAAKARLLRGLQRDHQRRLDVTGISAAWLAERDASEALDNLFDAAIDFRPQTIDESERRNAFLLRAMPKSASTQHTMARALFEAIMLCDSSRARYFGDERSYVRA